MVDIEIIIRKVIKKFKKKEGKERQRQEERAINWSFIQKKRQTTLWSEQNWK